MVKHLLRINLKFARAFEHVTKGDFKYVRAEMLVTLEKEEVKEVTRKLQSKRDKLTSKINKTMKEKVEHLLKYTENCLKHQLCGRNKTRIKAMRKEEERKRKEGLKRKEDPSMDKEREEMESILERAWRFSGKTLLFVVPQYMLLLYYNIMLIYLLGKHCVHCISHMAKLCYLLSFHSYGSHKFN